MTAEDLWQRLLDRLIAQGHVTRSMARATPAEIAASADQARGDGRVSRFVEQYYYPHAYGAADEAMAESEARTLVESICSGGQSAPVPETGGAFAIDGGASYATLQQALDVAETGATIFIGPGHHHASVVIDRDVRLVGRGDRAAIVLEGLGGPAIEIARGACELRHLTILGADAANGPAPLRIEGGTPKIVGCRLEGRGSWAAVSIFGDAAPLLDDCVVAGAGKGTGLRFGYRAAGEVRHCAIDGFAVGVRLGDRANPRLADCVIGPAVSNAFYASDEGQGRLVGCELKHAPDPPADVEKFPLIYIDDNASPRLEGCVVHDARGSGIYLHGGTCFIDGGEVRSVLSFGVDADNQAHAVLRNLTIQPGTGGGVRGSGDAKIEMDDCTIENSGSSSLSLGERATLTARRCHVRRGTLGGLWIWGGTARLERCELAGHGTSGVAFSQEKGTAASLHLERCMIADNRNDGIDSGGGNRIEAIGCVISGNHRHGIELGADVLVARDCRITGSGRTGIHVTGGRLRLADMHLSDNGIELHGRARLLMRGSARNELAGSGLLAAAHSRAVVVDVTIGASRQNFGIHAAEDARVALIRVKVEASHRHGVFVSERARLRACDLVVRRPGESGVSVGGSALAWINGASIEQPAEHGIEAAAKSRLACVGGRISGCRQYGVHVNTGATVILAATTLEDNAKASLWVGRGGTVQTRNCSIPPGSVVVADSGRVTGLT